jgi:hypothetical protein
VLAAEPSATAFVEAIYAPYKGKDAKGDALDTDAAVKRYFEPRLRGADQQGPQQGRQARRGLGPRHGSFIDAQDWDISTVDVAVRDTGADKASATVSFKNLGKPTTVVLDLVKLREGWRIADIELGPQANLARPVHQAIAAPYDAANQH